MIKGLYTAASGMMVQMTKQDVIANNIANANTTGFKKDQAICQTFPGMLISQVNGFSQAQQRGNSVGRPLPLGYLASGASIADIVTDYSSGSTRSTERSTDLAIGNEGYFAVQTPNGERFTRNGSLTINSEGILANQSGYPLLDIDDQPIQVDGSFVVNERGVVSMNGEIITQLKVVEFADMQILQKEGDLLNNNGQAYQQATRPGILQGYLESSNVNAVTEMVTLINTVRAYETCQKVIQAEDETLQVAIDQVGSVA